MKNQWRDENTGKTALANFSSQYYLMTMGTGILAVNLQTLPYQFPGLGILSVIVWVFDILLFLAVTGFFAAKWICFPATSYKQFSTEPELTFYFSCIAISTSTLLEMAALVLGSTWSGWDTACLVFWWCNVVLAVACAILPFWVAVRQEHVQVYNLPPTALYPATAILSTASAGAVVITYTPLSVRASLPILVVSIALAGMGFLLALAVLANYTGRLLMNSTPPPEKALASFIPLAAISNAGYSCSSLGRLAGPSRNLLASYGQGYTANATVGLAFYGAGVCAALGLIGFATYWFCFSAVVVLADIWHAPFSMNYWSALYPIGVYALAFGQLGMDFDSPAFRTLNTIFTCLLLLGWLYTLVRTLPGLITGNIALAHAEEYKKSTESFGDVRRLQSSDEESGGQQGEEESGQQQGQGEE